MMLLLLTTSALASLFTTPPMLTGRQHALLLLPLCLSIAIVYKTIRCPTIREIPLAVLALWITMVGGMYSVGVGLWILSIILT